MISQANQQVSFIRCIAGVAVALSLALTPAGVAQKCTTNPNVVVSMNDSSDTVYGPICVSVPVNALRYSPVIKLSTSAAAGSDLTGPFSGLAPQAVGLSELGQIVQEFHTLEEDARQIQSQDSHLLGLTNRAILALKATVANSDVVFQKQSVDGVRALVQDQNLLGIVDAYLDNTPAPGMRKPQIFLASDSTTDQILELQIRANTLLLSGGAAADPDKTTLATVTSGIKDLLTAVAPYSSNGDSATTYIKQATALNFWRGYIDGLSESDFYVSRNVACRVMGNQVKTISVVVGRLDLLPTLDSAAPTAADLPAPSLIVTCPSPFAVSGGMAVSFIKSNGYGLIPATTAGTYTYGVTESPSINPMPIAMVHAVLWEDNSRRFAFQVGVGAAAHVQDATAGGSNAEYTLGAGVRLFHTVFITPGLHIGRTASLSPGNHVGDMVPTGVTTAPIVSQFTSGFGLAITFTKP